MKPTENEILSFRRILTEVANMPFEEVEKYTEQFEKTGEIPESVEEYFTSGLMTGTRYGFI